MIDYTIAEFLGIFLIGFPILILMPVILFWGIYYIIERAFGLDITRIFHYHYHYKDHTK